MTEIHEAASEGDDEKLLDALKSGEDVNERDVDCGGRTALHWAASRGHIECCRLLIANGANSQITSFAGWTPLHSAAEAGHSSCVRYLLTTGVRASESDKAGDTARRVAERYGHRECAKLLKRSVKTQAGLGQFYQCEIILKARRVVHVKRTTHHPELGEVAAFPDTRRCG